MSSGIITNPSFGWWKIGNSSFEGEGRDWAMRNAGGCYCSDGKPRVKFPKLRSGQKWTLKDGRIIILLEKVKKRWLVKPRGVNNPNDFLLIPERNLYDKRYFCHIEEVPYYKVLEILRHVCLAV